MTDAPREVLVVPRQPAPVPAPAPAPRSRRGLRVAAAVLLGGALLATAVPAARADHVPEEDFGAVPPAEGYTVTSVSQVSLGVQHLVLERGSGPVVAHVARIRPEVGVRVRAVLSNDLVAGDGTRRETTSSMCRRTSCALAVNADYFDRDGRPEGPFVSDGELITTPEDGTVPLMFDAAGRPIMDHLPWSVSLAAAGRQLSLDAVNRAPADGEITLFTPRYGPSTDTPEDTLELVLDLGQPGPDTPPGGTPVRIRELRTGGDAGYATTQAVLAARGPEAAATVQGLYAAAAGGQGGDGLMVVDTGGIVEAVGGRPGLLLGGRYLFWPDNPAEQVQTPAPRTLVGWTADGTMLWVAVDGRRPGHSSGVTLPEATQLLVSLGAVEGINLDGGGSTTFVVGGGVQNRPSDSAGERPVSNALVVLPPSVASQRLAGQTRFDTAVVASRQLYPNGAPVAVLASGENFPDALAGAVLAARAGGPLLLIRRDEVPGIVASELRRLGVRQIALLGGLAAISQKVESELTFVLPGGVVRISGPDRYSTSAFVSSAAFPGGSQVAYLATGRTFPDALAASAGAAGQPGPVLLVDGDRPADAVVAELGRLGASRLVVVGGEGAVPQALVDRVAGGRAVERIAGADRYETAGRVTERFGPMVPQAVVATGQAFPDALSGASVAARAGLPLLLVPGTCVGSAAMAEADRRGTQQLFLMGGTAALGSGVERLVPCP
ncbi:MAG: cell wall-binding repeat-containing protein [Acidimicrobiales bacterium]|nr:cell wall-binding repeat-containing protein [Acidimicrobiales bacterium]